MDATVETKSGDFRHADEPAVGLTTGMFVDSAVEVRGNHSGAVQSFSTEKPVLNSSCGTRLGGWAREWAA